MFIFCLVRSTLRYLLGYSCSNSGLECNYAFLFSHMSMERKTRNTKNARWEKNHLIDGQGEEEPDAQSNERICFLLHKSSPVQSSRVELS